jgi:hypothetical protein
MLIIARGPLCAVALRPGGDGACARSADTWSARGEARLGRSHTVTDRSSRLPPTSPGQQGTSRAGAPRSAPESTGAPGHAARFPQPRVDRELGRLGTSRSLPRQRMRDRRPVLTATIGVARKLALTVDGERPSRRAIHLSDSPRALPNAISSRSEKVRHRPFSPRPRRGRIPLAARIHRRPFTR